MKTIIKNDEPLQAIQLTNTILEITAQIAISYMNHATAMAKISKEPEKYFTISVKQLLEDITQCFKKHYSLESRM